MTDQPTAEHRWVFNRYHRDAPPGATYIGRGSPYGNQFVIGDPAEGKHGDREAVVAAHRAYVLTSRAVLLRVRRDLAGRSLVCFCYPKACHGDVYAEVANMPSEDFARLIATLRDKPVEPEWPADDPHGWPAS